MSKKYNLDEPTWGLFPKENQKDLNERKSIKVKLPIRQHIRLHAMKLFTENNISETVEQALDRFFEEIKREQDGLGDTAEDVTAVGGETPVNGASDVTPPGE